MKTHTNKTQETRGPSVVGGSSQKQSNDAPAFQFVDNRPEAAAHEKFQEMADNSPQVKQLTAFQKEVNTAVIQRVVGPEPDPPFKSNLVWARWFAAMTPGELDIHLARHGMNRNSGGVAVMNQVLIRNGEAPITDALPPQQQEQSLKLGSAASSGEDPPEDDHRESKKKVVVKPEKASSSHSSESGSDDEGYEMLRGKYPDIGVDNALQLLESAFGTRINAGQMNDALMTKLIKSYSSKIRKAISAAGGEASDIPHDTYRELEAMASPLNYFIEYSTGITQSKRKTFARQVYDIKDKLEDA